MRYKCFADEIAIDFPAVGPAVERMRDAFLGDRGAEVLRAEVALTPREASDGLVVGLEVPLREACPDCGGRGETWSELCRLCGGSGESVYPYPVHVTLPAGVTDGARFRLRVMSPGAASVRVEVRIAIRPAAV